MDNKYINQWGLTDLKKLTVTLTSTIYEAKLSSGEKVILKVLTPLGVDDEATGAILLEWLDGEGAVKILNYDKGAHLLEYLQGPTLVPMVQAGYDFEAIKNLAKVIAKIHEPRLKPIAAGLVPLKERFCELYAQAGKSEFFNQAIVLTNKLLETQKISIPLHGDMHHLNVMHSSRGWLALDPKGLIGDPHYETANIFSNPDGMPELTLDKARHIKMAEYFAGTLALDKKRILEFAVAHAALSTCWNIMDGLDITRSMAVGNILMGLLKEI